MRCCLMTGGWLWLLASLALAQSLPENNPLTSEADIAEGREFFRGHCAQCHGHDGEGGRGVNLTTGRFRRSTTDRELLLTIQKGIPGTEMPRSRLPVDNLWKLVAYVRSLGRARASETATGDPNAGETVYHNEGGCVKCHVVGGAAGGNGGSLGPVLHDVGLRRSLKFLRESLTKPSAYVPQAFRAVTLVTVAGETYSGIRLNEDDYSIQMRDMNSDLHSFLKSELRELRSHKESLMPAYGNILSPKMLDDLVAYMNSLRTPR